MRTLITLCILALVVGMSVPAYAEVQNVTVSGDLTIRGIYQDNIDLQGSTTETAASNSSDSNDYFMTTTELQVDADLTDNVSTVVRLVNQRDWNTDLTLSDEFTVLVDLAYVKFEELLYEPLTVTIGRQDLWFGTGLIVGRNIQDPAASISADEMSAINSFDSIKATLDFDPWTVDAIYAKIQENTIAGEDDVNLYGANIGYKFDSYNAEAEGYYFYKHDGGTVANTVGDEDANEVHTFGLRGNVDPIKEMTVTAEAATQIGTYVGSTTQVNTRDREGYLIDVKADYRGWMDQYSWKPKVSAEYMYLSGNEYTNTGNKYTGWDGMYRGRFNTIIHDYLGRYYVTAQHTTADAFGLYDDNALTNRHEFMLSGIIEPTDSLTVEGLYGYFTLDDKVDTNGKDLGHEIDLTATYTYTEDVSFGLLAGWYIPQDHYQSPQDDTATAVMGTMKVSF